MGAALGPGRVQPTAVAREALQHVLARGHFFRRGEGEGEGGNVRASTSTWEHRRGLKYIVRGQLTKRKRHTHNVLSRDVQGPLG